MKSFFLSIIAGLGSLFGFHSQPMQPTPAPMVNVQTQATTTQSASQSASTSQAANSTTDKFTVTPPPVIIYPTGSDVLQRGHTYTITWQNQSSTIVNYTINLEHVSDGVYIGETTLGPVSSAQQSISFKVPTTIDPRTNYQLYFYNSANNDILVGSQAFTIK